MTAPMDDAGPGGQFSYDAFGLRIAAAIDLPVLSPCRDRTGPADVDIRLGPVPPLPAEPVFQGPFFQLGADGTARFAVPGVAAFLVEGGCRITVAPAPGASPRDCAPFLYGSVLGLLFHQRGLFPLQAATLEIGGRAVAFAGASGTGKSTLAAALCRQGCRLLADGVSVITPSAAGPVVMPAYPRLALWPDSLAALDLAPAGPRLRPAAGLDKAEHDMADRFQPAPRPLAAICHLRIRRRRQVPAAEAIGGATALGLMRAHIHRLHAAQRMGLEARLFADIGRIAPRLRHYVVRRPQDFADLPDFVRSVLDLLGGAEAA